MDARIIDYVREEIKELKADVNAFKNEVKEDFKTIDGKVDLLLEFKWKIVGSAIAISLIITTLFQIGIAILK